MPAETKLSTSRADPARLPARRAKRIRDARQLKLRVREHCLGEFHAFAGVEWDDRSGPWIAGEEFHVDCQLDDEASAILRRAAAAVGDLVAFSRKYKRGGGLSNAHHVRLAVAAHRLDRLHASGLLAPGPTPAEGAREGIVKRVGGRRSRREVSIISLCCGNFPAAALRRPGGSTVAQVIQDEMKAIGLAQRKLEARRARSTDPAAGPRAAIA